MPNKKHNWLKQIKLWYITQKTTSTGICLHLPLLYYFLIRNWHSEYSRNMGALSAFKFGFFFPFCVMFTWPCINVRHWDFAATEMKFLYLAFGFIDTGLISLQKRNDGLRGWWAKFQSNHFRRLHTTPHPLTDIRKNTNIAFIYIPKEH